VERYRIWRLYMAGMAHAFDRGWMTVAQVLALKPLPSGPAPRPWTRAYQYVPQAPVPLSHALDWAMGERLFDCMTVGTHLSGRSPSSTEEV
jgi:hypothetical protein